MLVFCTVFTGMDFATDWYGFLSLSRNRSNLLMLMLPSLSARQIQSTFGCTTAGITAYVSKVCVHD